MGADPHAAIGRLDGRGPGGGVPPEVTDVARQAELPQRAGLALPEVTLVKRVEAVGCELLEGPGQGRQPHELPGPPWPAVRSIHAEEPGLPAKRRLDQWRR